MSGPAPRRVLAVRLHGLGDMLMATPALRAMRRAWPQAELTALVGRSIAPVLAGNPNLDRVLAIDEQDFFRRRPLRLLRLALSLRAGRFDLAVVFSRSPTLRRFARLAGCRRVAGLARPRPSEEAAIADWRRTEYQVSEQIRLVEALGAPAAGEEMDFFIPPEARAKAAELLGSGGDWVCLAPGGGVNAASAMTERRWPLAGFARLAEILHQERGLKPVVVGGREDGPLARKLAELCACPILDATGQRLDVSAALLALSRLVVCNDSAPLHLALIAGPPTVALFGPSNHVAVVPPGRANLRIVRSGRDCSPCFWQAKPGMNPRLGRGRGLPCGDDLPLCLAEIEVEQVLAAAGELLDSRPAG